MKRVYWGLLAVVAIAVGVFLADILLAPGLFVTAAPYAVAIVVAAYFSSLWLVIAATGLTVVLLLVSSLVKPPPFPTWPLALIALAIVGGLAALLTSRAAREQTLAQERERLRDEAEREAAQLEATVGAISNGLIIYGPQGEIVRINEAAMRTLGVGPEWATLPIEERMRVTELQTADGTPMTRAEVPFTRALRGERVFEYRMAMRRPDGRRRQLLTSAGPIRDEEGHILGAVLDFADVTPLVELQEQREDMLRAVSHDLRQPLAGILGQSQLLERRLAGADLERERGSAEKITGTARRMNTMIQDLVDTARSQSGQLKLDRQPVDVRAFALGLKERLAESLETARIDVEMPEGLPTVLADPGRLERILTNLWSNALKYSTPGTRVTVSARHEDGWVITSVTDRGPGIAPEEMADLFQRYYRAEAGRERREGVGLGLYITRLLVEAHGGRVWAESEVGVGSTFSFSLPLTQT